MYKKGGQRKTENEKITALASKHFRSRAMDWIFRIFVVKNIKCGSETSEARGKRMSKLPIKSEQLLIVYSIRHITFNDRQQPMVGTSKQRGALALPYAIAQSVDGFIPLALMASPYFISFPDSKSSPIGYLVDIYSLVRFISELLSS